MSYMRSFFLSSFSFEERIRQLINFIPSSLKLQRDSRSTPVPILLSVNKLISCFVKLKSFARKSARGILMNKIVS